MQFSCSTADKSEKTKVRHIQPLAAPCIYHNITITLYPSNEPMSDPWFADQLSKGNRKMVECVD